MPRDVDRSNPFVRKEEWNGFERRYQERKNREPLTPAELVRIAHSIRNTYSPHTFKTYSAIRSFMHAPGWTLLGGRSIAAAMREGSARTAYEALMSWEEGSFI